MSLTVTQRPSITYLSETARWNAVKNPIVYKMLRADFAYNQANNSGGFMQMQFTGVNITSEFSIGDIVLTTTRGLGVVTAVSIPAGNTLVTIDQTFTTSSSGSVNNLTSRPLYAVEVDVYDTLGNLLNDAPFRYVADSTGNVFIDVSPILKANLLADATDIPLTSVAHNETNVYKKFYIVYREVWTGSAEAQVNESGTQFFAILGALQIPAANGGNMAIYSVPPVKFLTKLTRFVMWRGYPSLLSLIVSEDIAGDVFLDTGVDTTVPQTYAGKVISYDLKNIIVDQTISETTAQVFEEPSTAISEEIPVDLRDPCDNPIMLMGRNSLGGPLQWMFDENQEYTFDYGNGIKAKRMRLFADDLTINQWEALQDFFTLGEVYKNVIRELTSTTIKTATRTDNQVYVVSADGSMVGVIVIPRQPSTETKQVKHTFEIEIEYPEQFA